MKSPTFRRRVVIVSLFAAFALAVCWSLLSRTSPESTSPAVKRDSVSSIASANSRSTDNVQENVAATKSSARASAVSARSAAPAVALWGNVIVAQGEKLSRDPAVRAAKRMSSGPTLRGRSALLDGASLVSIAGLQPGESVTLPLFNGEQVAGTVNLVQAEADNWIRVGGALTGRNGTFALNSDGNRFEATVLLPDEDIAVVLNRQDDGSLAMEEKPLDEVLCTPMPLPEGTAQAGNTTASDVEVSAITIPILDSRPSATAVVYLDFDGETVTDPRWNGGATIVAAPAVVSAADVQTIWTSVKEDFWAFNITITTDLARYNAAPVNRRTRCIITTTDTAAPGSGGVAYINSFNRAGTTFSSTIPCWVFVPGPKPIAEAVSHEVGHTLGLRHDGRTSPAEEYYAGHGSGAVGWAPIMGVGYYRELVQWSKGEYPNPTNTEDDLAIITSSTNGFGYIGDEAGNSTATAAALPVSGTTISQSAIISNASDSDYYRFSVSGGASLSLNANPAAYSPNVDLLVDLLDAGGNVIATSNPDLALNATINTGLSAGTYYVRVMGTGRATFATGGYSNYGCSGEYTLSGTLTSAAQAPTISGLSNISATSGVQTPPMSFTVADADTDVNILALAATSSNTTLVPNANITFAGTGASRTISLLPVAGQTGTSTITVTVTDGVLTGTGSFVVTVSAPTSAPVFTTSPTSQTVTVGGGVTFNAAANGSPTPTYQWYKNGNPIGGATGTSYTINPVAMSDAGNYHVVASNSAGNTPSAVATLTVNAGGGSPLLSGTPIGSAPWHGLSAWNQFSAFDGNPTTAFDSEASFIYVGMDFGSPKKIDRLRFLPRQTLGARMLGGQFRVANAADLSDAVTIYTVTSIPPDGVWQDLVIASPASGYRYVFFTTDANGHGNVAELEFYGTSVAAVPAPTITSQPASQTVSAGSPAAFSVTVDLSTVTYQWYKNSSPIGGATGATFSIGATALSDAGTYTVVITSAGGSVTSNPAVLSVNPPGGGPALLTGTPIGASPWHGLSAWNKFSAFDGDPTTAFDSEDAFIYVGLDFGSAKNLTRLRFLPRQTLSARMLGGRFRVANAADLSDAVTVYTITSVPPDGVWQDITLPVAANGYRYVFFTTDANGHGNVAELEFYGTSGPSVPAPQIMTPPQSQTINEGLSVSFSVSVDVSSVTYQWYKNNVVIPGATGATYSIPVVLLADAGSYTVVVTGAGGSVTSSAAILTVIPISGSPKLNGTPIGSSPWHGLPEWGKLSAFDGNPATAFDSEDPAIYVGMDFGAPKIINRIRFLPRQTLNARMLGGRFRVANNPDFGDAVTIYTITSVPPDGVWQDITLPVAASGYRYIFFTTDADGHGNVAELEFYGSSSSGAPLLALNQVQSETVRVGESLQLSAGATPPGASYQWSKDGVAIPEATSATYRINVVLEEDAGVYTVKITEPSGETSTHVAFVVVEL